MFVTVRGGYCVCDARERAECYENRRLTVSYDTVFSNVYGHRRTEVTMTLRNYTRRSSVICTFHSHFKAVGVTC